MTDRATRPVLGPVRPFAFPEFSTSRLGNGLRILAIRDRRVPLVLLRLVSRAGAENDPPGRSGLASLTAGLLDEGTRHRSSREIAAEAERLGGYLVTGAGWDSTTAETSLLSRDLPVGLELLADIVTRPTFPPPEVSRLKHQTLGHLKRRSTQPAAIVSDIFNRALFEQGPYAHPLIGTESSLTSIDRDEITAFHQRWIRPLGSSLIAVGDVEPARLEQMATEHFEQWQGAAPRPTALPAPSPPAGRRIVVFDRTEAPQSEICVGHVGMRRSEPDYLVASVLNALLGGKFTSRVNLNLRERHGYTYGAHSNFARRRGAGPFMITAAVDNDAVAPAVQEILAEMERLRVERVPGGELRETLDYLIGSFPYTCETQAGLAQRLSDLAVHDLPDDYFASLPEALDSISSDQMLSCSRRRLDPDNALIAVTGPASTFTAALAEIAAPVLVQSPHGPW